MRSEAEIRERIDSLKERLEERKKRRASIAKSGSSRRNALGTTANRRYEGEIQGLTWVLEKSN